MTAFSPQDERHMARALELARRGLYTTDPNPRVGCVIVQDGRVVGEGWHVRAGEPHAEVLALQQAGPAARGATVYVSLEPCCHHGRTPPCSQALIQAGVGRVVAAMPDPNPAVAGRGVTALQQAGIQVEWGLLRDEAAQLNPGFVARMMRGRPYVRVKLAASLDGRTALVSGESKWISGEAARADVQRLRARSSAILTGAGTVLADDPSLNVRNIEQDVVPDGAHATDTPAPGMKSDESRPGTPAEFRQPLRVVVEGKRRMRADARLLSLPGRSLVVTAGTDRDHAERLRRAGAEVLVLPNGSGHVDLDALLRHLAGRGVNELLVEAGATLCGSMLQGGWVDELVVYLAPHLLGNNARGMFDLPALARMDQRLALDIMEVRAVGRDWRITARLKNS